MGILEERAALAATFTDKMTLKRQRVEGGNAVLETVYRDLPCALSRSAHTASPAPGAPLAALSESRYRMSLFMPCGTVTRLGDSVEVSRGTQIFSARASDSVEYDSHSVCVLDIREVNPVD